MIQLIPALSFPDPVLIPLFPPDALFYPAAPDVIIGVAVKIKRVIPWQGLSSACLHSTSLMTELVALAFSLAAELV